MSLGLSELSEHDDGPNLEHTNIDDWQLVGEGGANLVLAYRGACQKFRNRCIRLRKIPKGEEKSDASTTAYVGDKLSIEHQVSLPSSSSRPPRQQQEADSRIFFTREVISPLLGTEYLPSVQLLPVSEGFLKSLANNVEWQREEKRKDNDEIDTRRGNVILTDNLVGVGNSTDEQVLAVEIKPKWGFLPSPDNLSPSTRAVKRSHCRFCMHDYYKITSGCKSSGTPDLSKVPSLDRYCPLDLYSEEPARVHKAFVSLLGRWKETQGGANNLRIFFNGRMVRPSDDASLKAVAAFIETESFSLEAMARFLAKSMSRFPVLSRLKHLQASLDPLDVEGLSARFERSTHVSLYDWPHGRKGLEALDSVGLGETPTNEEWKSFVKLYLSDPDQLIQQTSDLPMCIIAFLLSATFKDCSIFLTMHGPSVPRATLKIVDVDSKPAERLGKFARKDQEIVDWFQTLLAEAKEAGIRVPACR